MSWSWLRIRLQVQFAIGREERTDWSTPRCVEYTIRGYNAQIAIDTRIFWDLCCEHTLTHQSINQYINGQPFAGERERKRVRDTMDRIGNHLLKESKAALVETNREKDERYKKRDLLSLLLKANLSTDISESQRMNDRDVLARKSLCLPHIRLELNIL